MKKQPKIAVSSQRIRLCDPEYNAAVCVSEAEKACANCADLIVFPELTLTGATAGDLFYQDVLLDRAEAALTQYVEATEKLDIMSFIGFPIKCEGYTYNAVACVHCGEIIGISASGLETAHFSKVPDQGISAMVAGQRVDVARDHIYSVNDDCDVFVKIGDDKYRVFEYIKYIFDN